ncbi:MAG: hypothetical protein IJL04_06160 [Bacteroidales bacterium]|nr:hypothetical protein [Bacteroidales bacterium]MBQ6101862.1 hypothetical protein [Bacteroidales bacterium]
MKASVSYKELQKLVTEQTNQPISFEFVNPKTVKVLYDLNLGIMKKTIGVDFKILDIVGTNLRVQYSAGFGMDSLVSMALNMVRDKIPVGLLEEQPDHVLLLHLDKIDKIKPVFERIEVKDINMLAEALELVGDFK